jgi:APA family basic amino acid/polyamine antiporter
MAALPWPTWRRLIVWFVIGIVIYFFYGVRRSKLAQAPMIETKQTGAG